MAIPVSIGALIGTVRRMQEFGMRTESMLAWPVLPGVAYLLADANMGAKAAIPAAALTAVGMLACLYRPGASTVRLQLVLGLSGWLALATVCGVLLIGINFVRDNDLRVVPTVSESWPLMLVTLAVWASGKAFLLLAAGAYATKN
jgi:hypothetical protein